MTPLRWMERSLWDDPWREMARMRREMDRLLSRSPFYSATVSEFPAINIVGNDDKLIVAAEVPGVDPADMEVTVVNNTLTISGTRKPYELQEGEKYVRQGRGYGNFTRSVALPFDVEPAKVEAKYDKGVLSITLPRAEKSKPKQITVKTA